MKSRWRDNLRQLLIMRLVSGLAVLAVAVGRWEYRQLQHGRWRLKIISVPLIFLGYLVSRGSRLLFKIISWPLVFIGTSLGRVFNLLPQVAAAPRRFSENLERQTRRWHWRPRSSFLKTALSFALLLMIVVAPFKFYGSYQNLVGLKDKIIASARAALGEMFVAKEAVEQSDLPTANTAFSQASANFFAAKNELDKVNNLLLSLAELVPGASGQLVANSKSLLEAGAVGNTLAAQLVNLWEELFNNPQNKDLVEVLNDFSRGGQSAYESARKLETALAQIDSAALPDEYREQFELLRAKNKFLADSLSELLDLAGKLKIFLGETYDRRYLLVFQNNSEARAAGGFMGSFAVVDFRRGQVKSLVVPPGGTYDTEAGLRRTIQSPRPLQLVKARWFFWDANWWPDWPASARKIMWFYEASGGSTVDGIISLTPTVISKLLAVVGPLDLRDNYGVMVTADNFLEVVQPFTEQVYGPTDKPKQIIGDLTIKLLEKLGQTKDQASWLKILGVIEQSLNERQLLLYFNDQNLVDKLKELGWDGGLRPAPEDYLMVVNSNIAGGKSDRVIKQTVEVVTKVLSDGSLVNHLTMTRDHQGVKGQLFSGVRNVNWLRVYVPLGSKLLESSGWRTPEAAFFERPEDSWEIDPDLINENGATRDDSGVLTYREGNKTVFANWTMVDPGQAAVIKLVYKLPDKLESKEVSATWLQKIKMQLAGETPPLLTRHSFLAQKQPGAVNSEINYRLELPSYYQTLWQYPQEASNNYQPQDTDHYWGFLLQSKND